MPTTASSPTPDRNVSHRRPPVFRIGVLSLVVIVIATVGWRYRQTPGEGSSQLVLQGNIDVRQVNLSFKVGGRIASMLVDEGDRVKAGDVIAALDARYFEDDLQLIKAQRDQMAANLDRLKNGSRPEEIDQARAVEAQKKAMLQEAAEDYNRAERLKKSGAVKDEDYEKKKAMWLGAKADLDAAGATRKLAELGPRKEDIAATQAQLDGADANVVVTQRRLDDSRLIAPNDGVMLTRAREKGAIVNPGETVFTLTLTSPVWVRTYVNEPDLGVIESGMKVIVSTDNHFGREYTGQVGFVSPTAEFTPKAVETRELRTDLVYRLRIIVDNPDGGLRQGMPVSVAVELPGKKKRTFRERLEEAMGIARPQTKTEGKMP